MYHYQAEPGKQSSKMYRTHAYSDTARSTFRIGQLLYVAVVLALVSVGVWDVMVIVDDYKSENRMTLVKTQKADNGTIPFLEGAMVEICLDFGRDTVFHELRLKNSTRLDKETILEEIEAFARDHEHQYPPYNLSLAQKIAVAKLFYDRFWNDYYAVLCIHKGTACPPLRSYEDQFYSILENFSLEALEESLWLSVRPTVMVSYDSDLSPSSIIPHVIMENMVCFELPLSKVLRSDKNAASFLLGVVADLDTFAHGYNLSKPVILSVGAGTYASEGMVVPLNQFTNIGLTVTNVGVYDKTRTTRCSMAERGNLQVVFFSDECFPVQMSEILKDTCACVPFSLRRYLPSLSASGLPYCTAEMYRNCSLAANSRWANRSECAPSCVTKKNQYVLKSYVQDEDVYMCSGASRNGWNQSGCSRMRFTIMVPDLTYLVYEERFQFTSTQLWSQIGGDIGLYTGISILSFWKLAVFSYMFYQNRKKKKRRQVAAIMGQQDQDGFLTIVLNYMNELADVHDPRDVDGVKADVDTFKKRLARIENMLDSLISKRNTAADDVSSV